jgi:hypothetical protein
LLRLIERLRSGLNDLDAGRIDAFAFDDLAHRYKRAANERWQLCSRLIQDAEHKDARWHPPEDRDRDWWAEAAPRRTR